MTLEACLKQNQVLEIFLWQYQRLAHLTDPTRGVSRTAGILPALAVTSLRGAETTLF